MSEARPAISVVVPFGGDRDEAELLRGSLAALRLGPGDELIVVDNVGRGAVDGLFDEPARVIRALAERSSYHARNAGARAARNDWILFVDADCAPVADLLGRYFAEPIPERAGAVAGEILGDPAQRSLAARYARDRKVLSQTDGLYGRGRTVAATGNLLVRRRAFEELDGFAEGIRSGGDVDFCLRLRPAGWALAFRPQALVRHRHRESVQALLRAFARYGAGSRWLNERHPGLAGRWPLNRELLRAGADAVRGALRGEREEAAFRAIDGLGLLAHNVGYRASNRVR